MIDAGRSGGVMQFARPARLRGVQLPRPRLREDSEALYVNERIFHYGYNFTLDIL